MAQADYSTCFKSTSLMMKGGLHQIDMTTVMKLTLAFVQYQNQEPMEEERVA